MSSNGLLIANVNPGLVTSDYMVSTLNFTLHDIKNRKILRGYLPWRAGALLDIYRNMVVENFLMQEDMEWLLFFDSDIEYDEDIPYMLIDAADPMSRPVISGIYPTLDETSTVRPALWYRGEAEDGRIKMLQYATIPEPNYADLIQVDGLPAGCLLIHRSLLETMRTVYPPAKPWFDMGVFDNVPYGEDFTFSMRVTQMGYPLLAHPEALVNHFKSIKLTLRIPSYASNPQS